LIEIKSNLTGKFPDFQRKIAHRIWENENALLEKGGVNKQVITLRFFYPQTEETYLI
jgi:hypothetical protein